MRFGIWPINEQPLHDVLDVARHAASTGWDGVWISDHLMPSRPPMERSVVECWTTMTAIIATVPRIRVGSLVLSNTFRHPGVVAKMAATLDAVDPGRLVLGLGAGWQAGEHQAYGIALESAVNRLRQLGEAASIVRMLLQDGLADVDGKYYRLEHAVAWPLPTEPIPILLGVKGDQALRIVARHADEWNLWASPEHLRNRSAVLARHCEAEQRDPASIRRSAQAVVAFTDAGDDVDPRWSVAGLPTMIGSVGQMQDAIGNYASAGLDELIVPDFALGAGKQRLELLDRFLSDVAAPFRTDE